MSLLALSSRRYSVLSGRKVERRTRELRLVRQHATGAARTTKVYVPSPRVPGARDQVQKVFDTIEQLWRARKIGDRAYKAAEMFRNAWDRIESVMGNAMDFDRVRSGGGLPGKPPAEAYLEACDRIDDAKTFLYHNDYETVAHVVGKGLSIKQVAPIVNLSMRETSYGLHRALDEMGKRWVPIGERRDEQRAQIFAHRNFDPRAMVSTSSQILRGTVVQADRRGIKVIKGQE
jgi:hypothetical protein